MGGDQSPGLCAMRGVCRTRGGSGGRGARRAPPSAAGGPGGRPRSLLLASGRAGLAGLGSAAGRRRDRKRKAAAAAALPPQEPSAGRRAGAAASRDRGRGARTPARGECGRRPARRRAAGAGAELRRGAPPAPSRTPAGDAARLPALPAALLRTAPRVCFPGPHSSRLPAGCAPPAAASRSRRTPLPRVPASPPRASDAPSPLAALWGAPRGARSGGQQGLAGRSWRHRAAASAVRAGGRARTLVPTPPRARPGHRQRPGAARPRGQKPAPSWLVLTPRFQT